MVLVPYRTGSRPFCSTNGNTVSPLGLKHSWLLLCLGRSRLLLLMLPGLLLDDNKQNPQKVWNMLKKEKVQMLHLIHCTAEKHFTILMHAGVHLFSTGGAEIVLKCCITHSKCAHCVCFCTWCFRWTALDFTALSGFWLEGRVAAVAPGYQLLPLVTLHFSNLDATPTGLTALRGHEGTGLLIFLYISLRIRPTDT